MTCCYCAGPVELPEPKMPAFCPACDVTFYPVEDYGWFTYSMMVYAPSTDRGDVSIRCRIGAITNPSNVLKQDSGSKCAIPAV